MNKLLLALALLPLAAANGFCGASSFGELMRSEPSVRAAGLGNAYAALDGDAMGLFYNPAQTAAAPAASAMFQRGYADDNTGAFAYSAPRLYRGIGFGAALLYYNAGDMDLYTNAGTRLSVNAEKDWLGAVNMSYAFTGHITAGAALKYAHESLFGTAGDGTMLADLGVLAKYDIADFGFALQNLGGSMELGSTTETVPVTWRLGAARRFALGQDAVTSACDLVHTGEEGATLRVGAEYDYRGLLAFRAGYELASATDDASVAQFGFGLKLNAWTFDYALVPYHKLGTTHRFGLSYRL